MKLCGDNQCERAGELLNPDQFCVNQSRDDGRNLYCRRCTVRRNRESRQGKRAQREARSLVEVSEEPESKQKAPSPAAKVLTAIENGMRTFEAITRSTLLNEDTVSDTLAHLAFEAESIRIVRNGQHREYRLAAKEEIYRKSGLAA